MTAVPTHYELLAMLARVSLRRVCGGAQVPPPNAREALKRAARTPTTEADPRAREHAVNEAVRSVHLLYPHLFRKDTP